MDSVEIREGEGRRKTEEDNKRNRKNRDMEEDRSVMREKTEAGIGNDIEEASPVPQTDGAYSQQSRFTDGERQNRQTD